MNDAGWIFWAAFIWPAGDAEAAAKAIVPFVDEQTLVVVRIRADLLPVGRIAALVAPMAPSADLETGAGIAAATILGETMAGAFRGAHGKDVFLMMSFGDAYLFRPRWAPKLVVPIPPKATADGLMRGLGSPSSVKTKVLANAVTMNCKLRERPVEGMESLLAEAVAAAGDAPLVGLLIVTPDHRRVFSETFKPLAGLRWASVAIEGPQPVKATLRVDFDTEANSKAVWRAWPELVPAEKLGPFHALMLPVVQDFNPRKRWEFTADDASGSLQRISGKLYEAYQAAARAADRERARQKQK